MRLRRWEGGGGREEEGGRKVGAGRRCPCWAEVGVVVVGFWCRKSGETEILASWEKGLPCFLLVRCCFRFRTLLFVRIGLLYFDFSIRLFLSTLCGV